MTFDKCEICTIYYPASGFFVGGETIPKDFDLFWSLTDEQWKKLVAADPRCRNTCGLCTVYRAKELGILDG